MADLLSRIPPVRTFGEMVAHIQDTIRHFPPDQRGDIAEELIDRAERRGAITADVAAALARQFLETETADVA